MFDGIQQCPTCQGAIHREHFVEEWLFDHSVITLLYCAHCDLGIETLWAVTLRYPREQFSVEYSRAKDPVKLGKFLQRLHDARAVAA